MTKRRTTPRRHYRKYAWIFGLSAVVIALLYWEQAAMLYVLSTLAMCALLVIVAFSKLAVRDSEVEPPAPEKPLLPAITPNQVVPRQP